MSNPMEVVEWQNAIIRIQSDVIDELFILLMQHISAEEADRLPALQKINQAVTLREDIGLQEGGTDGYTNYTR